MTKGTRQAVIWAVVIVVVLAVGFYLLTLASNRPAKLDAFTGCLEEEGAVFYGAFWCPSCRNQKALFGRSQKHIPYVECSTPDGRGQIEECTEKGITGYPTWEFGDGERLVGELPLSVLSEKTGCELPSE